MKLKLFTLDKRRLSPDAFEKTVQEFLRTSTDVIGFKAFECPHSGDVVLGFELSDARTVETEIVVCAWLDMSQVEELTNSICAGVAECGKRVRFVKIVPLSKSPRVLLAVLVEASSGSGSDNGSQQGETKEQDTRTNEGADAGTKRRVVRKNRKTTADGPA